MYSSLVWRPMVPTRRMAAAHWPPAWGSSWSVNERNKVGGWLRETACCVGWQEPLPRRLAAFNARPRPTFWSRDPRRDASQLVSCVGSTARWERGGATQDAGLFFLVKGTVRAGSAPSARWTRDTRGNRCRAMRDAPTGVPARGCPSNCGPPLALPCRAAPPAGPSDRRTRRGARART